MIEDEHVGFPMVNEEITNDYGKSLEGDKASEVASSPVSDDSTSEGVSSSEASSCASESENQEVESPEKTLAAKVEALQKDLDEAQNRVVRVLAESDNMRKRFAKERVELEKLALKKFMEDLLPVLDAFDKAVEVDTKDQEVVPSSERLMSGMQLVRKMLLDSMGGKGLSEIAAKGEVFDPNFHQAIQRIESSEVQSEVVKDEFQKGYLLNGRLLRATMVSVEVPSSNKDK